MASPAITLVSNLYGVVTGHLVDQDEQTYYIELSKPVSRPAYKFKKGDYIQVAKYACTAVEIGKPEEKKPNANKAAHK